MKGYLNGNGYMGFVNGRYILFASEAEYEEYMAEEEGTDGRRKNDQDYLLAHGTCHGPEHGNPGDRLSSSRRFGRKRRAVRIALSGART